MPETLAETQPAKDLNSDSPKKFNKVKLLQSLGLLSRKFNYETKEFERSLSLRLIFYLSLISKPVFAFKTFISNFFPRNDFIQLTIGNVNLYLPDDPKAYLATAAAIAGLWSLSFHIVFNYLNARKNYRLFKFWMKQTLELPVKSDEDYKVAGLSNQENKKFWLMENYINHVWSKILNWYIVILSTTFSSQLFFVRFDGVEIFSATYILFQTFHVIHLFYSVFTFLNCFYTLNLFYTTCMRFFSERFANIGRRAKKVSVSKLSAKAENQKISTLVIEYNVVHCDLIHINDFFKSYVGFNLISCFAFNLTLAFVELLEIDWRMKLAIFSIIIFLHMTIVYFPFALAKTVSTEIHRTTRQFENIAFRGPINREIKQKIESISNWSPKAGFTCFSWFLLNPSTGLKISLEFGISLLLLIQASFYYSAVTKSSNLV